MADHILSEEFLASAVFFQLQLLACNLVEVFKVAHLDRSWWRLRIKQLCFRLLNIAGVVAEHARRAVVRLSVDYRYLKTFQRVFQLLQVKPFELRLQPLVSSRNLAPFSRNFLWSFVLGGLDRGDGRKVHSLLPHWAQ